MPKQRQTTPKNEYHFRLHFLDGRTEDRIVLAPSFPSSIFDLPRMAQVGKYRYELVKGPRE